MPEGWKTNTPAEIIQAFANLGCLPRLAQGNTTATLLWWKEGPFKTEGNIKGVIKQIHFHGPWLFMELDQSTTQGNTYDLKSGKTRAETEQLEAYFTDPSLEFKYDYAEGSEDHLRIFSRHGAVLTLITKA